MFVSEWGGVLAKNKKYLVVKGKKGKNYKNIYKILIQKWIRTSQCKWHMHCPCTLKSLIDILF